MRFIGRPARTDLKDIKTYIFSFIFSFIYCRCGYISVFFISGFTSLILFIGLALDWQRLVYVRASSAQLVDSAALALLQEFSGAHDFSKMDETGRKFKKDFEDLVKKYAAAHNLEDNFVPQTLRLSVSPVDDKISSVRVCASGEVPLFFLRRDPSEIEVCGEGSSEVGRLEIALVYDSSRSMGGSAGGNRGEKKIDVLQRVTKSFLDSFPDEAWDEDMNGIANLRVGMIPFAAGVSIATRSANGGKTRHQIESGSPRWNWIDMDGHSSHNASKYLPLARGTSRIDIYDRMGIGWNGCVEARPYPLDVRDTPPNPSDPDTLWVPLLAPDEPDINNGRQLIYKNADMRRQYKKITCSNSVRNLFNNSYLFDSKNTSPEYLSANKRHKCGDSVPFNSQFHASYLNSRFKKLDKYDSGNLQYSRDFVRNFYSNNRNLKRTVQLGSPYKNCSVLPIIELTNDKDRLRKIVNKMHNRLEYGTMIPAGLAWGWRVLSPNEPFSQGGAYDTPSLQKILILMTDGRNGFRYSYESEQFKEEARFALSPYLYYGYTLEDGRIGDSDFSTDLRYSFNKRTDVAFDALDDRTLELCRNIRDTGIILYGITFGKKSDKDLMKKCVGSRRKSRYYFHADNGDELEDVFEEISNRIRNALYVSR